MMKSRPRKTSIAFGAFVAAVGAAAFAGQTQIWSQGDYADFERGVISNLSIRSDGLLSLAPHSHELFDTGQAYLWGLARDSKGNLYTAGGTGAKLFRIPPGGTGKMVAEVDALEIHAIAIDSKDRIYFGTAPDGKVYRLSGSGKPEVFYDPKAKYIWALVFDSKGNLLVATGGVPNGQGEIHKVTPDGKGSVFFKSDETHVRSMAIDSKDNLIVGTEPGGLVIRVSPAGEGFVLYQMAKKEVTAVAVAPDGAIYAAAVGIETGRRRLFAAATGHTRTGRGGDHQRHGLGNRPGARGSTPAGAAAGIGRKLPESAGEAKFTASNPMATRAAFGAMRATWSMPSRSTPRVACCSAPAIRAASIASNRPRNTRRCSPCPLTQITAFQNGPGGRLYAATGNTGKVFEIGPEVETAKARSKATSSIPRLYTLWGRLSFEAHLNGGQVAIATRSGNLDQPQKNWSAWSAAITSPKGGRVTSPSARFVQWKATLTADSGGHSPELESVDVAYLPKNVEPRIDEIEITPVNYRFPPPVLNLTAAPSGPSQSLTLPPLGRRSSLTLPWLPHRRPPAARRCSSQRDIWAPAGCIRPEWRFPALHGRIQGRK